MPNYIQAEVGAFTKPKRSPVNLQITGVVTVFDDMWAKKCNYCQATDRPVS